MNIKRAKEEIKDTIEAYLYRDEWGAYAIPSIRQRPVLLIGPPGVGKTQIMEQVAKECKVALVAYTITHHTRQSAVGLPFIEKRNFGGQEYSVTEYTMSEIVASVYNKMEETGLSEGILFLDEINCVSETLAPAMLQFLQCKTFGNHRLPEGWVIVAAGNPPEYNKSVREFDVVTLDRIKKITVEPDLEVWREYANIQQIHPAVLAYLSIKPQNFCCVETTVDGKRFATPRGWEDLSRLIQVYEKLEKSVDRDVTGQYLQFPKIAKDFANYLSLYAKYQEDYQVDEILAGTIRESLCDRLARAAFDERISVTSLILSRLNVGFAKLNLEAEIMGETLGIMKKCQDGPSASLYTQLRRLEMEQENLKKQELMTPHKAAFYRGVTERLERYGKKLNDAGRMAAANEFQDFPATKVCSAASPEEELALLRACFGEDSDRYEAAFAENGQKLEHAFDFFEAAFGDSQELVLFVTELNTRAASRKFLAEYECERFYEYNKRLLFEDAEEQLKEKSTQVE